MKRAPEPDPAAAALPSFLDAKDGSTSIDVVPSPDAEAAATDAPPDATETSEPIGRPAPEDDTQARGSDGNPPTSATSRRAATPRRTGAQGMAWVLGGAALMVAAAVVATLQGQGASMTELTRFGIGPQSLLVLGAVAIAAGTTRRRIETLQSGLVEVLGRNEAAARSMQEGLQFLVDSQHASNERPPAAGEELQHVLVALQRQDDKINNLTKAIKMYGKPLMEISGQGTELAGSVTQTRTAIETAAEATRQAFGRLEAQLRTAGAPPKELGELLVAVQKVGTIVETLRTKNSAPSLEPVQQQLGRVEVAVAALGQRLEDSEVRKSLLRLEDATQKARAEVQDLRGDGLPKATAQLQDRLDKSTTRLVDGLQKMREGNLGGLETSVREIQRELSGVATAVSQLQVAMRSAGRPAATPAAAQAPAPVPSAPSAPPPTAAPTPAAPAAADGGAAGGYQTGTRASTGKNVLGAIAKLKQMKS